MWRASFFEQSAHRVDGASRGVNVVDQEYISTWSPRLVDGKCFADVAAPVFVIKLFLWARVLDAVDARGVDRDV